jgi:Peptidase M30
VNFISSTLIHEATHMINYYQRSVLKGNGHDTWLEETTAMMSEDTLSNSVFGAGVYNKISGRTNTYLSTGGGVDYANWPTSLGNTTNYYNIGGAFGAYLNRRYGLAMVKGLATNCNDGTSTGTVSSYVCLDALIKTNGGAGFAEDYARFGASVFARIAATAQPAGYGFPSKTDGGYTYSAFDLSLRAAPAPVTLAGGLPATTHIFQTDTVAAGKTSYARTGMVVPANTTLIVVVQ